MKPFNGAFRWECGWVDYRKKTYYLLHSQYMQSGGNKKTILRRKTECYDVSCLTCSSVVICKHGIVARGHRFSNNYQPQQVYLPLFLFFIHFFIIILLLPCMILFDLGLLIALAVYVLSLIYWGHDALHLSLVGELHIIWEMKKKPPALCCLDFLVCTCVCAHFQYVYFVL